jgi:hypothetical protein
MVIFHSYVSLINVDSNLFYTDWLGGFQGTVYAQPDCVGPTKHQEPLHVVWQ